MASPIKMSSAVERVRAGTFARDQVAAFYIELRSPMCASLLRRKLPADEVEDIVQESFVRLLCHGPENLKSEEVRYWLFRVAHNLAIDRQRSGWRSLLDSQTDIDTVIPTYPSAGSDPEKTYLNREQWELVQGSLARLTPLQRHAIRLRIAGLSYKAIAHRLKGTTNSVGELIRRGLKRLGETGNDVID